MSPRRLHAHVSRPAQPTTRVRWWAVALPLAAFAALLCLLASGQAGDRQRPPPGLESVARVVPQVVLGLVS
jgi:hypothetical protein